MKKNKNYELILNFETEFDFEEEKIKKWLNENCYKVEQYFPNGADDKESGFGGSTEYYRIDLKHFPRRIFAKLQVK